MKGLEALEHIKRVCECEFDFEVNIGKDYKIIKKELTALEVIRKKSVHNIFDGSSILNTFLDDKQTVLIVEVLKNE